MKNRWHEVKGRESRFGKVWTKHTYGYGKFPIEEICENGYDYNCYLNTGDAYIHLHTSNSLAAAKQWMKNHIGNDIWMA